ncbi:MAG: preprotein translocase subunit YajC [Betaproteobacteria bacterium]|nr:preprotein translocase subunit YajC [Betaproteobacteria bacterium]
MAKILLVVLGLLLAYWILKIYRKRVEKRDGAPPAGRVEDMVQCAQCGVHLPRSESVTTRGNFYCSAEHQRLHSRPD